MKKVLLSLAVLGLLLVFASSASAGTNAVKTTIPGSPGYIIIKAREFINSNLMTFKKTSKAKLIDHYCDRRVDEMSYAQSVSQSQAFDTSLNRYEDQKTKALWLARQAGDKTVMEKINTNTLAQERQMTALQLMEQDQARKEKIVDVQKTVANESRTATTVVVGEDQGVKVENDINNVWYAEGTGAGDQATGAPAGWTYATGTGASTIEGGTSGTGGTTYSNGTGASNVEGGTSGTGGQTVEGSNPGTASGTSGGTAGQKVEGSNSGTSGSGGTAGQKVVQ